MDVIFSYSMERFLLFNLYFLETVCYFFDKLDVVNLFSFLFSLQIR